MLVRLFALIFIVIFFHSCGEGDGSSETGRIGAKSVNPNPFYFTAEQNAEINNFYTSNEVKITGISDINNTTVSLSDGELIINGAGHTGLSASIKNNDTLAVRLKSSSYYGLSKSATITLGGYSTDYIIETMEDKTIPPFSFYDITNAELNKEYTSNTITISGLGGGVTVDATISSGTDGKIVLNGTEMNENSVVVKNGDTIKLKLTSGGTESSTKSCTLSVNEVSDIFSVTTYPKIVSIAAYPNGETIEVGTSMIVYASVSPSNAQSDMLYTSSDTSVATVNQNSGIVTAIGVGGVTITATSIYEPQKSDSVAITVVTALPSIAPTSMTVSPSSVVLENGETKKLDALPYPSGNNSDIIWGSSHPDIVTVSSDGNITGMAPGKAVITAYSKDDMTIKATSNVTVEIYEELISNYHKDTVGSVVQTVFDASSSTLYVADSTPGIRSFQVNLTESTNDVNVTLSSLDTLDVNGTTEAIKLSTDGAMLFVADGYKGVKVLDVSDRESLIVGSSYSMGYLDGGKFAESLDVSADNSQIFIATNPGIEWLEYNSGNLVHIDEVLDVNSTSLQLTSDDKTLVLAAGSEGVVIYSVLGSSIVEDGRYTPQNCSEVRDVAISKDDKKVYVGCANGYIEIINIDNKAVPVFKGDYSTPESVESLKLSDNEDKLYVGNGTVGVTVLDVTFYDTDLGEFKPRAISAFNTVGFTNDIELIESSVIPILSVSDGGNGILLLK